MLPSHIRSLLIVYCLATCVAVLLVCTWIFSTSEQLIVVSESAKANSNSKNALQANLETVPPLSVSNLLEMRLRHVEMPIAETATVHESAKPIEPELPPPTFTIGRLIATFVEDEPEKSHAVFQTANGTLLLGIGLSIEQGGEQFTLQSVERRSATLVARGVSCVVAMQE
jgi:hypothetical protein